LIYKNSDIKTAERSGIDDKNTIYLKTLDLKEKHKNKSTNIYKLKVIDKTKMRNLKKNLKQKLRFRK
jgi:hypothetical protein